MSLLTGTKWRDASTRAGYPGQDVIPQMRKSLAFYFIDEYRQQSPRLVMNGVSSIFNAIQVFLAGLFVAAALISITISFAELSRLAERDAIKHVAERAITESR